MGLVALTETWNDSGLSKIEDYFSLVTFVFKQSRADRVTPGVTSSSLHGSPPLSLPRDEQEAEESTTRKSLTLLLLICQRSALCQIALSTCKGAVGTESLFWAAMNSDKLLGLLLLEKKMNKTRGYVPVTRSLL